MDKPEFLKTRVSEQVKAEFDQICKALGKQPTGQLRELVETFVRDHYGQLRDRVVVHIHRPEGYDHEAWRVSIKLRNPREMIWNGAAIPFALPELPKRLFIIDPEYRVVVTRPGTSDPVLGGRFVEGEWRAHVYSNGCPEAENPTPINIVRAQLLDTITGLIDRFQGERK